MQLPTSERLGQTNAPGAALRFVLDTMRVLVLTDADAFGPMGPARMAAWLEAGGGKLTHEIDLRALAKLRSIALAEVGRLVAPEQTAAAAAAIASRTDTEAMQLGLAVRYVDRRRELLMGVASWCDEAAAGLTKEGVWWWK